MTPRDWSENSPEGSWCFALRACLSWRTVHEGSALTRRILPEV
eukprot:CAMPEP_0114157888 /NCGR_PEP_ID=MMETSP0043_2-20121206/26878_1 /TAXON_ID=464988 /ORGANISM="Hemiselmis andersenii, Strain CCMP644" /LENGTH=42 /DNA_ID= /DNA_START= /DNA_END= /DNA_ORIENTATION=